MTNTVLGTHIPRPPNADDPSPRPPPRPTVVRLDRRLASTEALEAAEARARDQIDATEHHGRTALLLHILQTDEETTLLGSAASSHNLLEEAEAIAREKLDRAADRARDLIKIEAKATEAGIRKRWMALVNTAAAELVDLRAKVEGDLWAEFTSEAITLSTVQQAQLSSLHRHQDGRLGQTNAAPAVGRPVRLRGSAPSSAAAGATREAHASPVSPPRMECAYVPARGQVTAQPPYYMTPPRAPLPETVESATDAQMRGECLTSEDGSMMGSAASAPAAVGPRAGLKKFGNAFAVAGSTGAPLATSNSAGAHSGSGFGGGLGIGGGSAVGVGGAQRRSKPATTTTGLQELEDRQRGSISADQDARARIIRRNEIDQRYSARRALSGSCDASPKPSTAVPKSGGEPPAAVAENDTAPPVAEKGEAADPQSISMPVPGSWPSAPQRRTSLATGDGLGPQFSTLRVLMSVTSYQPDVGQFGAFEILRRAARDATERAVVPRCRTHVDVDARARYAARPFTLTRALVAAAKASQAQHPQMDFSAMSILQDSLHSAVSQKHVARRRLSFRDQGQPGGGGGGGGGVAGGGGCGSSQASAGQSAFESDLPFDRSTSRRSSVGSLGLGGAGGGAPWTPQFPGLNMFIQAAQQKLPYSQMGAINILKDAVTRKQTAKFRRSASITKTTESFSAVRAMLSSVGDSRQEDLTALHILRYATIRAVSQSQSNGQRSGSRRGSTASGSDRSISPARDNGAPNDEDNTAFAQKNFALLSLVAEDCGDFDAVRILKDAAAQRSGKGQTWRRSASLTAMESAQFAPYQSNAAGSHQLTIGKSGFKTLPLLFSAAKSDAVERGLVPALMILRYATVRVRFVSGTMKRVFPVEKTFPRLQHLFSARTDLMDNALGLKVLLQSAKALAVHDEDTGTVKRDPRTGQRVLRTKKRQSVAPQLLDDTFQRLRTAGRVAGEIAGDYEALDLLISAIPLRSVDSSVFETQDTRRSPRHDDSQSLDVSTRDDDSPTAIADASRLAHRFGGLRIVFAESDHDVESDNFRALWQQFKDGLQTTPIIGLDAEWVGKNPPALLQLASVTHCFVIRVHLLSDSTRKALLHDFLADPEILKCGVSIKGDHKRLAMLNLPLSGMLELSTASKDAPRPPTHNSLEAIYTHFVGVPMRKDKKTTISDWEATRLTQRQVAYAVDDAIAGLEIALRLFEHARGILLTCPTTDPAFQDTETASAKPTADPRTSAAQFREWAALYNPFRNGVPQPPRGKAPRPPKGPRSERTPLRAPVPMPTDLKLTETKPRTDNVKVLSRHGVHIFNCDIKKAMWYVVKKKLAVATKTSQRAGKAEGEDPWIEEIQLQFDPAIRTKLCMNHQLGKCEFGDNCFFAHGVDQLVRRPEDAEDAEHAADQATPSKNTDGDDITKAPLSPTPPEGEKPRSGPHSPEDAGAILIGSDFAAAAATAAATLASRPKECALCMAQGAMYSKFAVVPSHFRRYLVEPFCMPRAEDYALVCSQCLPRAQVAYNNERRRMWEDALGAVGADRSSRLNYAQASRLYKYCEMLASPARTQSIPHQRLREMARVVMDLFPRAGHPLAQVIATPATLSREVTRDAAEDAAEDTAEDTAVAGANANDEVGAVLDAAAPVAPATAPAADVDGDDDDELVDAAAKASTSSSSANRSPIPQDDDEVADEATTPKPHGSPAKASRDSILAHLARALPGDELEAISAVLADVLRFSLNDWNHTTEAMDVTKHFIHGSPAVAVVPSGANGSAEGPPPPYAEAAEALSKMTDEHMISSTSEPVPPAELKRLVQNASLFVQHWRYVFESHLKPSARPWGGPAEGCEYDPLVIKAAHCPEE